MSWIVYLLECSDQTLYCGITNNLEKRIKTHNEGKGAKYTRCRLPVKVVYQQEIENKSEALKLEIKIKKMRRYEKIRLFFNKDNTRKLLGVTLTPSPLILLFPF